MAFFILNKGLLKPHSFNYLGKHPKRVDDTRTGSQWRPFPFKQSKKMKAVYAIELMSEKVFTLSPQDTVSQAVSLFQGKGFRHIPIVQSKTLVGLISDRDIFKLDQFRDFDRLEIKEFMSELVLVCDEDTGLSHIANVMLNEKISALPVVNKQQQFVGIITLSDILKWIVESDLIPNQ